MVRDIVINPRATSQLQASVSMLNFKAHDTFFFLLVFVAKEPRESLFCLRRTWHRGMVLFKVAQTTKRLTFGQTIMPSPLWRCLAILHGVTFGENQTQHISTNNHTNINCQHGGGDGAMMWACFAPTWPWHLAITESTANSSVYSSILKSNVRTSVRQLKP